MATYITKEIAGFASTLIIDIAETMDGRHITWRVARHKIENSL